MGISDLMWMLALALVVAYWLDSMKTNEVARKAGRRACEQAQVMFLDDSVAIQKTRLRRNSVRQLSLYREYQFEFTSDGSQRYQGKISLIGKQLIDVHLDAYRMSPEHTYH